MCNNSEIVEYYFYEFGDRTVMKTTASEVRAALAELWYVGKFVPAEHRQIFLNSYELLERVAAEKEDEDNEEIDTTDSFDGEEVFDEVA